MMKKNIATRVMLAVGVMALAGLMMSGSAWAGVQGSDHDFSSWSTGTELCNVCHTPHNAPSTLVPLWNHATTATDTFALYSSDTMNATTGQPAGVSLACLSCHDGTLGSDAYGGSAGTDARKITTDANLGVTLSDDHPISFTYDAALATADGELVTPASTDAVVEGGVVPLFSSKVECATCHDVHDTVAVTGTALLVKSNASSALCLTCHAK